MCTAVLLFFLCSSHTPLVQPANRNDFVRIYRFTKHRRHEEQFRRTSRLRIVTQQVILDTNANKLSGALNLDTLPTTLVLLSVFENAFTGSISLTTLPECMQFLNMIKNKLLGTLDLTQLPQGLLGLYLSSNDFFGETDFSQLPPLLEELFLQNTRLSGDLHKNMKERRYFVAEGSDIRVHMDFVLNDR